MFSMSHFVTYHCYMIELQDLTISISTERSIDQVSLVEDRSALGSVNVNAFMDAQEWKLYKHVESFKDITTVEYASSTVHPILHVQCRVSRKIGYFMWNIVFIMVSAFWQVYYNIYLV